MLNIKKLYQNFLSVLLVNLLIFHTVFPVYAQATSDNPDTVLRDSWFFNQTDTATSGEPSNLKYFKHFDAMPEEINLKIFKDQDLSHLEGKKLFVGYGLADPKNGDCKVFPASETGYTNDITVCLPWWRIEREYVVKKTNPEVSAQNQILEDIKKNTRPPINFKTCKAWDNGKQYPGGKVTCTSYYDRNASSSCWSNPEQPECWVNNCSENIKNYCTYIDSAVGEKTTLETATNSAVGSPVATSTKINLISHQYDCPSGPLVEKVKCLDEVSATIFPQECSEGVYEYCDERRPNFDGAGNLVSYSGTCSNGKEIVCEANKFNTQSKICTAPIYKDYETSDIQSATLTRDYQTFEADVLSGEPDIYMAKDNCLRANTVEDARNQELFVKIKGSGFLDDDIYVLRHASDGSHIKVYCNMQHAENRGNRKNYNGDILQCIDNDGNYSFNKTTEIKTTDIVSVQQNSENENVSGTPFALGRNHYGSTKLTIDGVEVAPETFAGNFPYYPRDSTWLRTWDNTTSTFSILFPFAGAYDIRFYNKSNAEVAKALISIEDFREIVEDGSLQLKLGKNMKLAPKMQDDIIKEDGTKTLKANREDNWVEWGGGVFGGRHSTKGTSVLKPNDSYVKQNAVHSVIIKDLITGAITPIPLVYPLPYPNRVFVSKLNVYEKRKYRCYNDFPDTTFLGTSTSSEIKQVCSTDPNYIDYKSGLSIDSTIIPKWENETICGQNCRQYEECTLNTNDNYTCEQRGGEDIGGDIAGNEFSSKTSCNEQCYKQNECVDFRDNKCNLVEEKVSEPISDMYGKTVFRKKEVAYRCIDNVRKQVGCDKWEYKDLEGDTTFRHDAGFETFDFSSNFEKAVTHAANLEVGMLHIWSGWKGECVYGKKWDFSYLSDPMTLVSYAMMAYSSYEWFSSTGTATTGDSGTGGTDGGGGSGGTDAGAGAGGAVSSTAGTTTSTWGQFQESISKITTDFQAGWDDLATNVSESLETVTKPFTNAYNDLMTSLGDITTNNPFSDSLSGIKDSVSNISDSIASGVTDNPIAEAIKNSYDSVSGSVDSFYNNAMSKINNLTNDTFMGEMIGTLEGSYQKVTDFLAKDIIGQSGDWVHITYGKLAKFGINVAMAAMAPPPEAYQKADQILKGYYGMSSEESDLVAYNSCMASIGLSFPNLISWAWDDENSNISEQLKAPYQNPIRLTASQIGAIASTTSQEYVMNNYLMREDADDFLISLVAINPKAYFKAGQVLCAGPEVSKAMDHIGHDKSENSDSGGGIDAASIAIAAIGMFCAPCAFALTIIMDLATNVFASIDTCRNEEDAMQWDILHYKTQKFQLQDQCHHTATECDQESSWFGCVRKRKEYCCYDMILTKIFAEGLKEQLGKGWESCNDITINDLKDVSFTECLPNQNPKIDKCMPIGKYTEFEQALFRQATKKLDKKFSTGLVEQVKNSMAIIGK